MERADPPVFARFSALRISILFLFEAPMTAAEPTSTRPGMITAAQAASLLMLSQDRLRQLVADGHIPKASRNEYPLVGVVQGYIRFLKDEDRRAQKSAAESGLKQARQSEIEMRIAERRRDLVARSEVEAAMHHVVSEIDLALSGLASRVTRDPALREKIHTTLDEILSRIADRLAAEKAVLASGPKVHLHG